MIPVTTIGGYLGAGKTTLVNQLLRQANGRRLAVLVNEFGALPIDADLIEARDGDMISIAGGCICCSFGNDLIGALRDLAQLSPAPDHILIEASGVAIPSGIAASVSLLPEYELGAVVVLADVETIEAQAQDAYLGDTILRQLSDADLVLATKGDLVAEGKQSGALSWLQEQAPRAGVVAVTNGQVSLDVVLGPRAGFDEIVGAGHADALFRSRVVDAPNPVDVKAVAARLASEEFGLVRAKGFLQGEDGRTHLLQMVGKRVDVSAYDGPVSRFALVCINRADAADFSSEALFGVHPS